MKKTALWLAVIFLLFQAVSQTETIKSAVYGGVMRCTNIIIPSLFFMMCVSGIATRSGIISKAAFVSDRFSRFTFGMNGEAFVIFLFSMLAGYPIGAKMLNELYNSGKITKEQTEKYLCVCYGAGGAFVCGCVTQYGNDAEKLIMLSNIIANIVIAFILGLIFRKQLSDKSECQKISGKRGVMLCESVADASKGMLMLCGMIIFFSALIAISEPVYSRFVTSEQKMKIICCLLDVSTITELNIYTYRFLPIVSGLISFGGICVIMQIKAIISSEIRIRFFILVRVFAGLLSGIICRILLPFFIKGGDVIKANADFRVKSSYSSPVVSIMLAVMIFILVLEQGNLKKSNAK
ncbi:MAG: hypothetical protein MJ231_09120, partial [bacterium]|nr:hypothetical protein [bacterium]